MLIQQLELKIGERAVCYAGYPHKSKLVVECKKDFSEAKNSDDIVNDPHGYLNIIERGMTGISTSHVISANWEKL